MACGMVGSPEIRLGFQVMEEHLHLSPSSHDSCGVSLPHYLPLFYWQHLYGLVVYILFCVAVLIYISQGIYFIFRNKVRSGDKVEQWRRLYGDVIGAVALILGFSFILIFSNGKIRERALWDLAFSLVGVVLSSAIFALPSLFSKRSKRASSVKA
jgi:hypothetical protein